MRSVTRLLLTVQYYLPDIGTQQTLMVSTRQTSPPEQNGSNSRKLRCESLEFLGRDSHPTIWIAEEINVPSPLATITPLLS